MSAGHKHVGAVESTEVERAINDPKVQALLAQKPTLNKNYDLPYLAGYSNNGRTIYIDRHLPNLGYDPFLEVHEHTEKSVIDGLGYTYPAAHEVATACERRAVLSAGLNWNNYQNTLKPYIKADEVEKLQSVPPDLDLTPYQGSGKLLERLTAAQGE